AFADRLASDGYDLIAVGRDDVRLGELATAYPEVAVRTIASDLSTAHGVESVISSIGDVPIDLLINNAGVAHYGSLANLLPRQVSEVLGVKAIAPVMLTHAVVGGMIARGRGSIVNVGGMIAFSGPAPLIRPAEPFRVRRHARPSPRVLAAHVNGTAGNGRARAGAPARCRRDGVPHPTGDGSQRNPA